MIYSNVMHISKMQEFYSGLMGKDEAKVMNKIENASSRPKVELVQTFVKDYESSLKENFIIQ